MTNCFGTHHVGAWTVLLIIGWLTEMSDSGRIVPNLETDRESLPTATTNQRPIDIYWNTSNPLFGGVGSSINRGTSLLSSSATPTDERIVSERDNVVVNVNTDRGPFEYDQVNIICPTRAAEDLPAERFIIYSVSQAEYDECRVDGDRPKIVAVCDNPDNFMYFTITFRSFSPSPRQLEFKPGESYYFLSTSSQVDLQARQGGYCSSHHMKLIFRVAETATGYDRLSSSEADLNQLRPAFWSKYWLSRVPDARDLYSHRIDLGNGDSDSDPHGEMLRSRSPRRNSAASTLLMAKWHLQLSAVLILIVSYRGPCWL